MANSLEMAMHPRTAANLLLFVLAATLSALLVYGLVTLYRVSALPWDSLSITHKLGITALALVASILLVGALAKLLFHGLGTKLSDRDIEEISESFSIFYDLEMLLKHPKTSYGDFERCLQTLCTRLDRIYQFGEEKTRKLQCLKELVNSKYPTYQNHLDLGFGRSGLSFDWVPKSSDNWVPIIARTQDLAILSDIARGLKHFNHPKAGVAYLRYLQEVSEKLGPSWKAAHYIKMSETSKLPDCKPAPTYQNTARTASNRETIKPLALLEKLAKEGLRLSGASI